MNTLWRLIVLSSALLLFSCSNHEASLGPYEPSTDAGLLFESPSNVSDARSSRESYADKVKDKKQPCTKEVCDGKDNNCNGKIDEGIEPLPCKASKLPICKPGKRVCIRGKISRCTGTVYPLSPACLGSSDLNCDGLPDTNTMGVQSGEIRFNIDYEYEFSIYHVFKELSFSYYLIGRNRDSCRVIELWKTSSGRPPLITELARDCSYHPAFDLRTAYARLYNIGKRSLFTGFCSSADVFYGASFLKYCKFYLYNKQSNLVREVTLPGDLAEYEPLEFFAVQEPGKEYPALVVKFFKKKSSKSEATKLSIVSFGINSATGKLFRPFWLKRDLLVKSNFNFTFKRTLYGAAHGSGMIVFLLLHGTEKEKNMLLLDVKAGREVRERRFLFSENGRTSPPFLISDLVVEGQYVSFLYQSFVFHSRDKGYSRLIRKAVLNLQANTYKVETLLSLFTGYKGFYARASLERDAASAGLLIGLGSCEQGERSELFYYDLDLNKNKPNKKLLISTSPHPQQLHILSNGNSHSVYWFSTDRTACSDRYDYKIGGSPSLIHSLNISACRK